MGCLFCVGAYYLDFMVYRCHESMHLHFFTGIVFLSAFVYDRELKISSFVSDLKAGKTRALEVLNKIPHIIPHRKVNYSILADSFIWRAPKLMHLFNQDWKVSTQVVYRKILKSAYRRIGISGACAYWDNSKTICAT